VAQYQPTSRRHIADAFRRTAEGATRLCVRLQIGPDAISYLSMVAAFLAAVLFWKSGRHPLFLFFAPLLCYVRLWCNMLDGMVALASGRASLRGEILNDLPDRVSDLLIFVGVAHSGLMKPFLGYWAAMLALLTAYVGMLGQAVGVHREFSGIMSKPWRMVFLHAGAWVTLGCLWWNNGDISFGNLTILDLTCVIVIAGCFQTIIVRLKRIMAGLRTKAAGN
jgi:phosphatidylglycerophosphate synthase